MGLLLYLLRDLGRLRITTGGQKSAREVEPRGIVDVRRAALVYPLKALGSRWRESAFRPHRFSASSLVRASRWKIILCRMDVSPGYAVLLR